jgi:hypothetical protein
MGPWSLNALHPVTSVPHSHNSVEARQARRGRTLDRSRCTDRLTCADPPIRRRQQQMEQMWLRGVAQRLDLDDLRVVSELAHGRHRRVAPRRRDVVARVSPPDAQPASLSSAPLGWTTPWVANAESGRTAPDTSARAQARRGSPTEMHQPSGCVCSAAKGLLATVPWLLAHDGGNARCNVDPIGTPP